MKKLLFIFVLISVSVLAFGQRENTLPLKALSAATDTIRVVKDNQSSLMLRSVLQGAIYDSLATHTDTLQALRADIDAGGSSQLMDSITVHRTELNNLHDSITDHRIDIDANLDSIATHRGELNDLTDSISAHRTDIDANASDITTNASNISANSVFISTNTNDISDLQDSIAKHTDTLQLHQTQIAALELENDSSWVQIGVDTITAYYGDRLYLKDDTIQLGTISDASKSSQINIRAGKSSLYSTSDPAYAFDDTWAEISAQSTASSSTSAIWAGDALGNLLGVRASDVFGVTVYDDLLNKGLTYDFDYSAVGSLDDDWVPNWKTVKDYANDSVDFYWSKTGTDISPSTAGDDILLGTNEYIKFGDGQSYIFGYSEDTVLISANGSLQFLISPLNTWNYNHFLPGGVSTYDLGTSSFWWRYAYFDRYYVDNTSNYLSSSGSDLVFTDGVTGSKTLAQLVAGATNYWQRTGTRISPLNSGDSILINTGEAILFGDGTAWLEEQGPGNAITVNADGVGSFRFTGGANTSYQNLVGSTSLQLGTQGIPWGIANIDTVYLDYLTNTKIYHDTGTDDLTFNDATTGTKTLAELAASGTADSSWISSQHDTIKGFTINDEHSIVFGQDGESNNTLFLGLETGSTEDSWLKFVDDGSRLYGRDYTNGRITDMQLSSEWFVVQHQSSSGTNYIRMDSTLFMIQDGHDQTGIEYADIDYEDNFTDSTLVHKKYVDDAVNAIGADSSWTSISIDTLNTNGTVIRTGGNQIPLSATKSWDLGSSSNMYDDLWIDDIYIDRTDGGINISRDGSYNMTFTDVVTGTKTLSQLAPYMVYNYVSAAAVMTWTNMPAAETLFLASSGRYITNLDLSQFTQVRLVVNKRATAGAASSKLILKYSTTYTATVGSLSNIGTSEVSCAINTTNTVITSSWIDLASGAIDDVYVAVTGSGGDGILDPQFGTINLQFR